MGEIELPTDQLRIAGAGPTLSYAVVESVDCTTHSHITLLCLHGNSSHRGIWRLVARELESRWNAALERVADLEARIARHDKAASLRPEVNTAALMALAHDLPAVWNAPGTDAILTLQLTADDGLVQASDTMLWLVTTCR